MGVAVAGRPKRSIKPVDLMTDREREHLIQELEIQHRTAIVDAGKIRRQIRELNANLEAKQEHIDHLADGIAVLREAGER